jgi:hypothetical protein
MISGVKAPWTSSLTSSSKRHCTSNVVSHDYVSMCTKKDYGLHCHLLGTHNIHKHLILCLHGSVKITPPDHEHVVQLCADCFVQTLDGLRIGCVKFELKAEQFCPMWEVVTRSFRKSGSSRRAGGRPFLIISSLEHSTKSAWVGVLISTVWPLPRHGRFPSSLPVAPTYTGVSAQPPTEIRLTYERFICLH